MPADLFYGEWSYGKVKWPADRFGTLGFYLLGDPGLCTMMGWYTSHTHGYICRTLIVSDPCRTDAPIGQSLAFCAMTLALDMAHANACDDSTSTDEEMPGEDNMWCPLLSAAYHYYIGQRLAQFLCYHSKANVSQTCHFAVFISPIERESVARFLHQFEPPRGSEDAASTACSSGSEVAECRTALCPLT